MRNLVRQEGDNRPKKEPKSDNEQVTVPLALISPTTSGHSIVLS